MERIVELLIKEEDLLKRKTIALVKEKYPIDNEDIEVIWAFVYGLVIRRLSIVIGDETERNLDESPLEEFEIKNSNNSFSYGIIFSMLKMLKESIVESIIEDNFNWDLQKEQLFSLRDFFNSLEIELCSYAEKSIRAKERQFFRIFSNSGAGLFVIDALGQMKLLNLEGERLLGWREEELVGRKIHDIIHFQDEWGNISSEDHCPIMSHLDTQTQETIEGEILLTRKDGSTFWAFILATFILDEGKKMEAIVGFRDITEWKQAEIHMLRAQEILREKDKLATVGQIAAGVAHEVRNPLTAVRGFAQIIKSKYKEDHELINYMDIMLGEIDRVNEVVQDFLQLARPQELKLKLQSMELLVKELLYIVDCQALLNKVEIVFEIEDDVPPCQVDKSQIKQVLLNMMRNSMEAMADGGTIHIRVKNFEEQLLIEVEDTGEGIPQDIIDHIGTPFYSTKGNGTGLGLSISYSIIKCHNGWVKVESQEGKGTLFSIFLPCVRQGDFLPSC